MIDHPYFAHQLIADRQRQALAAAALAHLLRDVPRRRRRRGLRALARRDEIAAAPRLALR